MSILDQKRERSRPELKSGRVLRVTLTLVMGVQRIRTERAAAPGERGAGGSEALGGDPVRCVNPISLTPRADTRAVARQAGHDVVL